MKKILIIALSLLSLHSFSQYDTLLLLSGRKVPGKINSIGDRVVKMDVKAKDGVMKPAEIERFRVFSVTYVEQKEQILYKQDTIAGHDYTVKEMQRLIYGEQDAQAKHNMTLPFVLSAGIGAFGGYMTHTDFSVVAVPFLSMLATAILTPQGIRDSAVRNQKYRHDGPYKTGYRRVRKAKKGRNIVWGSVMGTVAGVIVGVVAN